MQIENYKFTRGFTGHEHLDKFQLINMNGRLYDPVIARFLSPDPYVANNTFTQDFNRYSYCRNNPLLYTDPSGELFVIDDILIGAAVGCIVNFWIQGFSGNINGTGDALTAMGIGALSGGIGAGVGSLVSLGLGTATTLTSSIGNGMIIGGSGGFVSGAGNAWANGATFLDGLTAGLISGGIGAASGAIIGGISGGISYHKAQLYDNIMNGKTPISKEELEKAQIYKRNYNSTTTSMEETLQLQDRVNTINNPYDDLCWPKKMPTYTTKVPDNYELYQNAYFVNNDGYVVFGVTDYKNSTINICRGIANNTNNDLFKAVVNHEYIHFYHHNLYGGKFVPAYSECIAYDYTINTLSNYPILSYSFWKTKNHLGLNFPSNYPLPFGL